MNNKTKLHMSTDEFRKAGYKAIDWIADYYEKIEDYPVCLLYTSDAADDP